MVQREDVTDGLAIFRVKLDTPLEDKPDIKAPFTPGQYLTIGLNRPDGDENDPRPVSVLRPMSIASAPETIDTLEFYIRYVNHPESTLPLTHLLWDIKDGDRMYVRPSAVGRFTEKDTVGDRQGKTLIMLAAGTGLAPFVSIAQSRINQNPQDSLEDLVIIHGASNPTFLGYKDQLEAMSKSHGLKYIPTVSRPKESPGWTGSFGRAEHLLNPNRIAETEEKLGIEIVPEKATFMVCGLNGTIRETILGLLGRGFVPHHRRIRKALEVPEDRPSSIFYEQYDSEPVINVKDEALMNELKQTLSQALGR